MHRDYDLIILGGGSAGIVAGVMAGGLKLHTLLIEKDRLGGECLNTGCVPSKALLHAASIAHTLRTADRCGLRKRGVSRADSAGALRFARDAVAVVRQADATEQLLRGHGVDLRFGIARFLDPHTLQIEAQELTADNFLIASGSRPAVTAIPGLEDGGYRTNQTIFDLHEAPARLLVVGGGPVGVEMAQAFQRLGSRVTLATRSDRLLPHDDAELADALMAALRSEGIDIRPGHALASVRASGQTRIAELTGPNGRSEVAADEILLGVGRLPNVEGMDLERAGVRTGSRGIETDAYLRTSARHIYAAGDVQGAAPFSHMAEYEAKIAVRNIVFPGASQAELRFAPWTTFTDPEVAHVGMTEDDARSAGIRYEVYRQPFAQDDRALVDGAASGFVKVITAGALGTVRGAHIIGPRAGELIQEWIPVVRERRSIRSIADRIHVYPTLTMASQHAAQRWYERKAQDPLVDTALTAYARVVRPRRGAIALGLLGATGLAGAALAQAVLARRRRPA